MFEANSDDDLLPRMSLLLSPSETIDNKSEMDLIEVLWKQDVDLGYNPPLPQNNPTSTQKEAKVEDDIERLETLLELKDDKKFDRDESNPWNGLPYTIDTETGEYILQTCTSDDATNEDLNNLLLDDALQFVIESDINTKEVEEASASSSNQEKSKAGEVGEEEEEDLESVLINNLKFNGEDGEFDLSSPLSNLFDESEDLNILNNDMMIQSSSTHFQHPRQPSQNYAHCVNGYRQNSYQGRVPLARSTMSMEQRWQDLANLLSFPPTMSMSDMSSHAAHHHHYSQHYGYQTHPAVLHNASLADIVSQPNASHLQQYSGSNINLGSAVATSMHLTNSTSETDAGNSSYKMDHDMLYYSHPNPNELNHTSDGFLNILNDDDLLMDIAVNEGMYTMRMLDQNGTNTSNATNPHLNNTILGNHLPTNVSSGLGSMAGSTNVTGNTDRLDASSDSAVSSMGSERVASLSDGEWNEAGSDSAQEYNVRKFSSPYDYRFNRAMVSNRQPVAQKKHQMYGKRFAHEPALLHHQPPHSSVVPPELASNTPMKFEPFDGYSSIENPVPVGPSSSSSQALLKPSTSTNTSEIKYSYAIDFPHRQQVKTGNSVPSAQETISHNHTYSLHPHNPQIMNNNGANPRPQTRDKKTKKSEDEHLTRDEKRARALQIPITVIDIINLPMDEFNERLSKYDLSENQLSLIRDIRRRGKNKVAAQNCRKRKLDQIISLSDEVKEMKMRKDRFLREHEMLLTERRRIKDKFSLLYRHVFNNLRDSEGNAYSSYQYSLQQSADGSVVLVPRSLSDQNSDNATSNGSAGSSRHNNGQHSGNNNSTNFK